MPPSPPPPGRAGSQVMNQYSDFLETATMMQVGYPKIHLQVKGGCGGSGPHPSRPSTVPLSYPSLQVHLFKG